MTTQEILEAACAARSALGLSSGEVRRAALLIQPAVFHGQAHAVQQDTVQGLGIG